MSNQSPHIQDEPAKPADQFADDAMNGKAMRGHPEGRAVPENGLHRGWLQRVGRRVARAIGIGTT
ncbi:MAG: hypothetical protein AAFO93_03530 [Pseudomonadota bacterium]